jgi:hypothetical protein
MKHILKSIKTNTYVSSIIHDCYGMTEDINKAERLTENEALLRVIITTYGEALFEVIKVEV